MFFVWKSVRLSWEKQGEHMNIDDILIKQLKNWWDINGLEETVIRDNIDNALKSFYFNFKDINAKRCENLTESNPLNPLHSVQWAVFLYKFSYLLFLDGHEKLASQVYYLNKIMHSNDWFYEVELPMHFYAEHPLGSVLGRAKYGDYFFIYQRMHGRWKWGSVPRNWKTRSDVVG